MLLKDCEYYLHQYKFQCWLIINCVRLFDFVFTTGGIDVLDIVMRAKVTLNVVVHEI